MRRTILDRVVEATDPEDATDVARELMVERFGPPTAAWLVMKHRRHFHARGAFDFVIPVKTTDEDAEKLRWFYIAVEFLRRRAGWSVEVFTHRGERRFRVRWLSWPHWGAQDALRAHA